MQRRHRVKDITFDRRALHGDIPQALREKTMKAFREKKFSVLVATDVAARGLDCIVDLVVMNKPRQRGRAGPTRRRTSIDPEERAEREGRVRVSRCTN